MINVVQHIREDCEMQHDESDAQDQENDENKENSLMDDGCEMKSVEEESKDTEDNYIHSDQKLDEDDESQNPDTFTLDKQLFLTFFDTFQLQKLPFEEPLTHYILKNASHRLLRRLLKSCKFLFCKKSTPVCYRLDIGLRGKFDSESVTLPDSCNPDLYVKNTFVIGSIEISSTSEDGEIYMSKIIPRLSRCEAKYIYLDSQELTFKEFKFLAKNGQVVQYEMFYGCIKDENNKYVDLEKIMAYLPNIEKLRLTKVKSNANTAHALSNQCFNGKIYDFNISSIFGKPFDPYEFLQFCVKNRDESFLLRMIFDKSFDDRFDLDFVRDFKEIMIDYEESSKFTNVTVRFRF